MLFSDCFSNAGNAGWIGNTTGTLGLRHRRDHFSLRYCAPRFVAAALWSLFEFAVAAIDVVTVSLTERSKYKVPPLNRARKLCNRIFDTKDVDLMDSFIASFALHVQGYHSRSIGFIR